MKYLIVGTGGVGGSIAGFLALNGKDVTCIARGEHLDALQKNGLHLISGLKGEHLLGVKASTAEAYHDQADVIFVCVKSYSLDTIQELLCRASHSGTVIIPIQNGFGMGDHLASLMPHLTIADGCIYIVGYISAPGEITQKGTIFRMVYGARSNAPIEEAKLGEIAEELRESGIKVDVSDDIRRDTFVKWSYISAMAATGAYYDVAMGKIQQEGEPRQTFIGLSQESGEVAKAMGICLPHDQVEYNLKVLDKVTPDTTASMQKDLAKGNRTEVDSLIFEMLRRGKAYGFAMPTYERIAARFASNEMS